MGFDWAAQFQALRILLLQDGTRYGLSVLGAILIFVIGWSVAGLASRGLRRVLLRQRWMDATLVPLLASILRYSLLIVTALAVLDQFGVQTTSFIAVLGAAGLAIGLALQGTLTNVASGVMLLLLRPFRVGDAIEAGSVVGTVDEVGLFTTQLRTADNRFLSVPNKLLIEVPIVNASRTSTRRLDLTLRLDAAAEVERALGLVDQLLQADVRIARAPAPVFGVQTLGDGYLDLLAQFSTNAAEAQSVRFDLNRAIKQRFDDAGIPFARRFPAEQARA